MGTLWKHKSKSFRSIADFLGRLIVLAGAVGLTLLFFMVLPFMQTLAKPPAMDLIVQAVDTAKLEAPPPPPESEPEPEEKSPEKPPEFIDEAPPLDLAQIELALDPGFGEGWLGGDFAVKLHSIVSEQAEVDALFSIADLDQKPRILYQPSPTLTLELRKKAPATVYIIFIVNQAGRVENPVVQSSPDPIFENPALNAVKQWKFEPGKRGGQPVRFRMRVPITFPKG
ncbi:MAG TPA: TonB family protein [Anaerohalosphaeraceae bacterium]|nr:TonB family protein [Anaerohalosphaeraceae bacterium]HPB93644.1 TonB family protein [Anaerohalosphaeraceae bacterium]HRT24438.1 TonB family protein [Anaerohalosphaeraceae bacterium]